MKNFKAININSEKLLKNEELIQLKGGSEPECCTCICVQISTGNPYGYLVSETCDCQPDCVYAFGEDATGMRIRYD